MIRLTFFLFFLAVIGCKEKNEKVIEVKLTEPQIDSLLNNWRLDSIGCLRLRDPDRMWIYANKLIGKDSIEVVRQLGPPNFKYDGAGQRHFQYILMCGRNGRSYYNFNFHFSKDTLESFSNPVH